MCFPGLELGGTAFRVVNWKEPSHSRGRVSHEFTIEQKRLSENRSAGDRYADYAGGGHAGETGGTPACATGFQAEIEWTNRFTPYAISG